jgi:uncharacterized protein (DUF1501 family)
MKRRDFLGKALPAGIVIPTLISGFSFKAFGASQLLSALTAGNTETDRVFVIVQLNGGNDGLNTVIPLDQYDNLANARSNILLDNKKILSLSGYDTGLHPALKGLSALYNQKELQVIQSVGYPQPNFSHFRATDIWLSGADANQYLNSGWLGRYLNDEYPNYPVGYPNSVMTDPLALQIGSFISPAFQGPSVNMGMAITDPVNFYNLINGIVDPAPQSNAGKELTYIRQISQQTQQYADVIKSAAGKVPNQKAYPSNNTLANQLKIVSRLIAGGLKTRIYMVNIGGFDTHAQQAVSGATETGAHALLLAKVGDAIKAFTDDLKFLGASKRVVGMTFSEFGRRIKSNASLGTDHGAAAPLFVFGEGVQSGVLGKNPTINSLVGAADNIPMQYDFRSVYSTILQNWFCVPGTSLQKIILKDYQSLPIIKPLYTCASGVVSNLDPNKNAGINIISNYPNPFSQRTTFTYESAGGHVLIQIFDVQGKLMETILDGLKDIGSYNLAFESSKLRSGIYYARLQNGALQQVRTIQVVN